jgi:hypothetical protein
MLRQCPLVSPRIKKEKEEEKANKRIKQEKE